MRLAPGREREEQEQEGRHEQHDPEVARQEGGGQDPHRQQGYQSSLSCVNSVIAYG